MLPTTTERVPASTPPAYNAAISRELHAQVSFYRDNPHGIDRRLRELDAEWDIERLLEANASALAFSGAALALLRGRLWLAVPLAVTAFLFQHALQGWCPPVPLFRHLGFRTSHEIETERHALKLIRGDYGSGGWRDRSAGDVLRTVGA